MTEPPPPATPIDDLGAADTIVVTQSTAAAVVFLANDHAKFCSLAFKLWTDPYVGKLVFFRVYSGQLKKGDVIYNARTRKRERVSRVIDHDQAASMEKKKQEGYF